MAAPHASLKPGSPLWPIFVFLKGRGLQGATSLEIAERYQEVNKGAIMNVSVAVADVRKVCRSLGYITLPAKYEGKKGNRKVYRYWVLPLGSEWPTAVRHKRPSTATAPPASPARADSDTEAITDRCGQAYFVSP